MQTSTPVVEIPIAETGVKARIENGTHSQILKSSAMVGGSQVVNIAIGIVRTKTIAVMLGPSGFGLFGLYTSVASLAQTLADMGVYGSGVRQIAAAVSAGDQKRLAETILVLRRISILLGLLGVSMMILFSRMISKLTFGNEDHRAAICWLSISVFLMLISTSQGALIQGLRRIADLAKMQIFGAVAGAVSGITLVYFYRERGVVPSIICVAVMTISVSWWYSRKASVSIRFDDARSMTLDRTRQEAAELLKLGLALMASSLIPLGVAYLVRITLLKKIGIEATGIYQSAWTLGGLYVGFILQAMGADFYPRLTENAKDHVACRRLVNEQTHVGLLMATPGILATLTFAPIVVTMFYSAKFAPAVGILRWICLGTMLQVITWPMGFVVIAKAQRVLLVTAEVSWGIVTVILSWFCIARFGMTGAGLAFFLSYVFHGFMLYAIVSRLIGFRWSVENWKVCLLSLSLVAIVFGGFFVLPMYYALVVGVVAAILSGVFSVRSLMRLMEHEDLPAPIRKVMRLLRITSSRMEA